MEMDLPPFLWPKNREPSPHDSLRDEYMSSTSHFAPRGGRFSNSNAVNNVAQHSSPELCISFHFFGRCDREAARKECHHLHHQHHARDQKIAPSLAPLPMEVSAFRSAVQTQTAENTAVSPINASGKRYKDNRNTKKRKPDSFPLESTTHVEERPAKHTRLDLNYTDNKNDSSGNSSSPTQHPPPQKNQTCLYATPPPLIPPTILTPKHSFWYHGTCKRQTGCEFLHGLTDPPSMVQPPPHYLHRGMGCGLPYCPGNWRPDGVQRLVAMMGEEERETGVEEEEEECWYLQGFDERLS